MKNYVMSALGLIFHFLPQIYNEQIGDLLDPTQRNLEVGTSYALAHLMYYFGITLMRA